jgi:hypothetical protein
MADKENAHEHTGSAETLRPSLRNGFTAYFVLSPVIGFLATVALRKISRNLTPAPRRQDHTTSPSASSAPRQRALSRPSHPASNVRDDRDTPLLWARDGAKVLLIWVKRKAKYFFRRDWTTQISLNLLGKSDFTRARFLR